MTSIAFLICLIASQALAWEALPEIPTGRRSQFLVLREDGAYKFGYDTGSGSAAKQEGDTSNEVSGQYVYKGPGGQDIDLKYTSGIGGFKPEGLERIQALIKSSAPSGPSAPSNSYLPAAQPYSGGGGGEGGDDGDDGSYHPEKYESGDDTGDSSYNFNVDTSSYKRTESSDARGNVQGSYSYTNRDGTHDLQYTAGAETGFIARSGSLSKPNGLRGGGGAGARSGGYDESSYSGSGGFSSGAAPKGPINSDGSYSFGFSNGDQSREESGDASGNVRGRFSYRNQAGNHDLSFQAGAETGFLVTGGSLAKPNGLPNGAGAGAGAGDYSGPSSYSAPASGSPSFRSSSGGSSDGAYSFGFSTGSQDRQEDSDASGNVRGRFSYKNSAGTHDLSYVAGASTGFLPTGGSLSQPNGLKGGASPAGPSGRSYGSEDDGQYHPEGDYQDDQADSGDSSYNFNFDTPDYTRRESSDARGNVMGSYRFRNSAGSHDLSFEAGSATGFKPTGGSLTPAPGLSESQLRAGFRGSGSFRSSSGSSSSGSYDSESYESSGPAAPVPDTKPSSYSLGNVRVHTYLPPSNQKHKFGYIFDTQY